MTPESPDAPPPLPPPAVTSDDLRRFIRSQNIKALVVAIPLLIVGAVSLVFAGMGLEASRDSASATKISLANNERNVCITGLRNEGLDAIGRVIVEGLLVQKAALVDSDTAAAREHLRLFEEAVVDRQANADATQPDALNEICGPPILNKDDVSNPDND